jgi:2-hydroxycyclohexanecarboxyl-CoA dehydrogenase
MTDRIRQAPLGAKLMTQMEQVTPLKRLAAPSEVAAIVSYFASDDAAFTTGQTVSISGGLSMHG